MRTRAHSRGFTLIELMVVIAIIGVLAAIMFGVNTQTYGASPSNSADQLVSGFNLCKMRAVSTRRWHRCEVTPNTLTIMQWQNVGMAVPGVGNWQVITTTNIGAGVAVWDKSTVVCSASPCAGAPASANAGLVFDVDYKPDGSSTGGTVFITDPGANKKYRVVVYKATGSSYARNSW